MAVLALVWITVSAMPLQGSSSTRDVNAVEIVSDPHPRDYWRMDWGNTYTVPAGKVLVITEGGHSKPQGGSLTVVIDGIRIVGFSYGSAGPVSLGAGIAATAGQIVSLDDGSTTNGAPLIWGYLVDA